MENVRKLNNLGKTLFEQNLTTMANNMTHVFWKELIKA